jgi:hypothetical protein
MSPLKIAFKAVVIACIFWLILFARFAEAEVRHTKKLTGLTPGTLYNYRIKTTDLTTGVQYVSGNHTFTTTASPPPVQPSGFHAPAPTSSLIVNVRDKGATGNGSTDDTAAIQAAINQVGGTGGTVFVPDGTYLVSRAATGDTRIALSLKSNMTFKMSSGATIKLRPNSSTTYYVLYMPGLTNVNIVGGKLQGERHQHGTPGDDAYTTPADSNCPNADSCYGQWGMGIGVYGGSNIYVEGIHLREMWGDGIYVSNVSNINIYSIVADDNRRQAISLIRANGVVIRDSVLKNTYGHKPQAGVDFEPNTAGENITNVQIINNTITGNRGSGLQVSVPDRLGATAITAYVTITGNTITGNARFGDYTAGVMITGSGVHDVTMKNNTIKNNSGACGVQIDNSAPNIVTNNIIGSSTAQSCWIRERFKTGNTISPNTLI